MKYAILNKEKTKIVNVVVANMPKTELWLPNPPKHVSAGCSYNTSSGYESAEEYCVRCDKKRAKEFVRSELRRTAYIVQETDDSEHLPLMRYRQALREWKNSPDFPANRPELGSEPLQSQSDKRKK